MRTFHLMWLLAFVLLTAGNLQARQNQSIVLGQFLQTMPVPQPSLKQMMAANKNYDAVEQEFRNAYGILNNQSSSLYQPIYQRYNKAAVNGGSKKASAAEQTILNAMEQSAKGLSDHVQFDVFKMQMLNRPLVGNGRPVWALQQPAPESPAALKTYQQLKALEASFDWKAFSVAAENFLPKFGQMDKQVEAINKKFSADLQNIPKKKLTAPEGFTYETEDPEKAIALWQQHGQQKQKAFDQQYALVYAWWSQQYKKLSAVAEDLDAFSVHINDDETGGMSTLKPLLADLQLRTLEAFYQLTAVSQQLFNDTTLALAGEAQVKDAISIYQQLK